jgi:UDP-N-acetylmuramoylalanine--D-glutamate ligase
MMQDAAAKASQIVVGMGRTGLSCARFLARRGVPFAVVDSRERPPALESFRSEFPDVELRTGALDAAFLAGARELLVSPGLDPHGPALAAARAAGAAVIGDIELFHREARAPIVAITGTNGKSTVTTLVGMMAHAAGLRCGCGGNLGTPALELLDPAAALYVLELSSFQLETGVYARCRLAVVNRDEPALAALLPAGTPVIGFGLGKPGEGEFGVLHRADGDWLAHGSEALLPVTALQLTGRHNISNALAALALGTACGLAPATLLPGLRVYRPLPHRMAIVASADGRTWIDDSKATNVGAAVASIGSLDGPLVLIAGGDGKGASFTMLADALRGRECVAVLLGRDRELLAAALQDICPVRRVDDMPAAVREARAVARPGWTVLLAPACSSLDMYSDYGARGDAFRAAVLALPEQGA